MAAQSDITIVVATYNRPQTLLRAIASARAQTHSRWTMLVIGDACTDDTGERVESLGDPRVRFINLPERFGEQAGPNSVGAALAETALVAFLNHDDLWLPDHLERAVAQIGAADLYWSASAWFEGRGPRDDLAFFFAAPQPQSNFDAAYESWLAIEPMSAWVCRRSLIGRLGPMALSSQTALRPIQDYAIRAAQAGALVQAGGQITVLKDCVRLAPPIYANGGRYGDLLLEEIVSGGVERLRARIEEDLWLADSLGMEAVHLPQAMAGAIAPARQVDAATGMNLAALRAFAEGEGGAVIGEVLTQRTGGTLTRQPDVEQMIAYARSRL